MAAPLNDTHFIDMLFLELSLVTNATTKKELELQSQVTRLKALCGELWIKYKPDKMYSGDNAMEQRLKDEGVVNEKPETTEDEAREWMG